MDKNYIYKLTHDTGAAPCVSHGVLTLAICKPAIRSTAEENDWIFGFGGKDLGGRLIYIARVTQKFDGRDYFSDQYAHRRDCCYGWKGGGFAIRSGRWPHGENDKDSDLGKHPVFSRAHVLMSKGDAFRYLGENGYRIDGRMYPAINKLLSGLRSGHRVHGFSKELIDELTALRQEVWKNFAYPTGGQPSMKNECSSDASGCRQS